MSSYWTTEEITDILVSIGADPDAVTQNIRDAKADGHTTVGFQGVSYLYVGDDFWMKPLPPFKW